MSAHVLRFQKKQAQQADWAQEELAQFYRVAASLNRAGLAVETDRGVSDEGDPWFVFSRAGTDEIIIHFARCDGVYVIASPGLDQVARGRDFAALLEPLLARYVPFVNLAKADRKTVTLHPSALLFALVVTCLFHVERSEAHTTSASRANADVAPNPNSPQPASDTERAAPVSGGESSNYRQVVTAVAAAIGSAATLEQWESATSNVSSDTAPVVALTPAHVQQSDAAATTDQYESSIAQVQSAELHHPIKASVEPAEELAAPAPKVLTLSTEADDHRSFEVSPLVPSGVSYELSGIERDWKWSEAHSPIPHHDALPLPETTEIVPGASSAAPPSTISEPAPSHTEAYQDVLQVLGGALTAHEVGDTAGLEPQLIFELLESQNSGASEAQTNPGPAVTEKSPQADTAQLASGNVDSAPIATGVQSTPQSVGTVTKQINATNAQVETAVDHFIAAHPDYQLIDSNQEMIIYDPHITSQNSSHVDVSSFFFSDGSSVVLIGLAQAQLAG